jgi:hypothetical protein
MLAPCRGSLAPIADNSSFEDAAKVDRIVRDAESVRETAGATAGDGQLAD